MRSWTLRWVPVPSPKRLGGAGSAGVGGWVGGAGPAPGAEAQQSAVRGLARQPLHAERAAPLAPQKIMHTRKRHQDMFQDLNRKLQHAERDKETPGPESKVQGRGACGVGRGEPGEGCLLPPPRPAPSSHLPGGGLPPPKLGWGGTSRRWVRPRAPSASAMGGSEPGWGTARRGVLSRQAPPGAPCRPRQRPARPVEGPRAPPSRSPCPFRSSDCTPFSPPPPLVLALPLGPRPPSSQRSSRRPASGRGRACAAPTGRPPGCGRSWSRCPRRRWSCGAWSGRRRAPPSRWWARTSSTSRPRSERPGHGGRAAGRRTRARAAATPPRPRALGGRPDRGPQSWDQSQSEGQEVAAAPVAQGSRRPEAPRTLPSSDPAPAGGRAAAADHGQAGCGRLPRDARPSRCDKGPACPAQPARHRFLDPHPREAASPPQPSGARGPFPTRHSRHLRPARPGPEAHSGHSSSGQSIFSLLFFSSIKRVKNPRPLCATSPWTARGLGPTGLGPSAASRRLGRPQLRPAAPGLGVRTRGPAVTWPPAAACLPGGQRGSLTNPGVPAPHPRPSSDFATHRGDVWPPGALSRPRVTHRGW